jgi:hypothetical protein
MPPREHRRSDPVGFVDTPARNPEARKRSDDRRPTTERSERLMLVPRCTTCLRVRRQRRSRSPVVGLCSGARTGRLGESTASVVFEDLASRDIGPCDVRGVGGSRTRGRVESQHGDASLETRLPKMRCRGALNNGRAVNPSRESWRTGCSGKESTRGTNAIELAPSLRNLATRWFQPVTTRGRPSLQARVSLRERAATQRPQRSRTV